MKFYLFSFILESAVVRSEMENYVQVDSLTVVDFAMLYMVTRRLLLSSRVSLLVINLFESFTIQVVRVIDRGTQRQFSEEYLFGRRFEI